MKRQGRSSGNNKPVNSDSKPPDVIGRPKLAALPKLSEKKEDNKNRGKNEPDDNGESKSVEKIVPEMTGTTDTPIQSSVENSNKVESGSMVEIQVIPVEEIPSVIPLPEETPLVESIPIETPDGSVAETSAVSSPKIEPPLEPVAETVVEVPFSLNNPEKGYPDGPKGVVLDLEEKTKQKILAYEEQMKTYEKEMNTRLEKAKEELKLLEQRNQQEKEQAILLEQKKRIEEENMEKLKIENRKRKLEEDARMEKSRIEAEKRLESDKQLQLEKFERQEREERELRERKEHEEREFREKQEAMIQIQNRLLLLQKQEQEKKATIEKSLKTLEKEEQIKKASLEKLSLEEEKRRQGLLELQEREKERERELQEREKELQEKLQRITREEAEKREAEKKQIEKTLEREKTRIPSPKDNTPIRINGEEISRDKLNFVPLGTKNNSPVMHPVSNTPLTQLPVISGRIVELGKKKEPTTLSSPQIDTTHLPPLRIDPVSVKNEVKSEKEPEISVISEVLPVIISKPLPEFPGSPEILPKTPEDSDISDTDDPEPKIEEKEDEEDEDEEDEDEEEEDEEEEDEEEVTRRKIEEQKQLFTEKIRKEREEISRLQKKREITEKEIEQKKKIDKEIAILKKELEKEKLQREKLELQEKELQDELKAEIERDEEKERRKNSDSDSESSDSESEEVKKKKKVRVKRRRKVVRKEPSTPKPVEYGNPIPLPNYASMTIGEAARWRADFKTKLSILREIYPALEIPKFDDSVPLEVIHHHYERYHHQLLVDNVATDYQIYLFILFAGIELFCVLLLQLDMGGYTINQLTMMNRYNRLLVELGEKSSVGMGSSWSPEVRIGVLAIVNAIVFLVIRLIADYFGPIIGPLLQQIVNSFMSGGNAATEIQKAAAAQSGMTYETPEADSGTDIPAVPVKSKGLIGNILNIFGMGGNKAATPAAAPTSREPLYDE